MLSGTSLQYSSEQVYRVLRSASSLIRDNTDFLAEYADILVSEAYAPKEGQQKRETTEKSMDYIDAIINQKTFIPTEFAVQDFMTAMDRVLEESDNLMPDTIIDSLMKTINIHDPHAVGNFFQELTNTNNKTTNNLAEMLYTYLHLYKLTINWLTLQEIVSYLSAEDAYLAIAEAIAKLSFDKEKRVQQDVQCLLATVQPYLAEKLVQKFCRFIKRQLPEDITLQYKLLFEQALSNPEYALTFAEWKLKKAVEKGEMKLAREILINERFNISTQVKQELMTTTIFAPNYAQHRMEALGTTRRGAVGTTMVNDLSAPNIVKSTATRNPKLK